MLEKKSSTPLPTTCDGCENSGWVNAPWTVPVGTAAIILLTLVAYAPLRWAKYIWDDRLWLLHNPVVIHWDKLLLAWINMTQNPQYYPLVFTVFSLEYHVWGFNPICYHLVNILLQAANALLLWWLLVRLRINGAWLAAAIFAIHPVQVETVGWIAEMKNLLCGFFYLLSALAYVRAARLDEPVSAVSSPLGAAGPFRWNWYWVATAFFLLALLAKTAGLALPLVLLALIWWRRGKIQRSDLQPLILWLVIAVMFAWITIHVEHTAAGAEGRPWDLSLLQRVLIAGRAWWFYPGKLVWPIPLLEVYRRWNLQTLGGWHWVYPIAALAVLAGLWLGRGRLGRGPLVTVLIYTMLIGPILGLISYYTMLYTFVADHYQYLACIALITGFAAGLWRLTQLAGRRSRIIFGVCSAVVLIFLAEISFGQSENYESSTLLWGHVLSYDPNSSEGNLGYGEALNTLGNHFHQHTLLVQALPYLQKANRLLPDNAYIHMALAQIHEDLRHYRRARWYWLRVLDRIPNQVFAWKELAWCLERLHDYPLAARAYQHVLRYDPHNIGAATELAALYLLDGQKAKAQAAYQRVIRMNPAMAKVPLHIPPWLQPQTSATTRPGVFHSGNIRTLEPLPR